MIFKSLVLMTMLTPLPFGSNTPWAWSLWALVIGILTLAWAIKFLLFKSPIIFLSRIKNFFDVIAVFFAVIIWSAVQAYWQPNNINIVLPLWSLSMEALQSSTLNTLSLTSADTETSLMRLISYALTFGLAFYYCQIPKNAYLVLMSIIMTGSLYAFYGLIIKFGHYELVLWQKKTNYINDLTSTFINRNHFATYAGICLLCSCALLIKNINRSAEYQIGGYLGLQGFIDQLITRAWLPLFTVFLFGSVLLQTHSRGGFFSTFFALTALILLLLLNKQHRNYYLFIFLGTLIILALILFQVSMAGLLGRLEQQGLDDSYREQIYQTTWNAIRSNPWLGFGLGSFAEVFAIFKPISIAGSEMHPLLVDYAHNTYLECIFEMGLPAALALFYCVLRLAIHCLYGVFARKRDWIYPLTGVSTTCLISTHALVDFSMQIPAIAFTYCLIMGAATAQSLSSQPSTQSN